MDKDKLRAFFYARVKPSQDPSECWVWRGTINSSHGYGECSIGSRGSITRWRAHRLSYILHHGEIPEGLVVMHSCDNRRCVNPAHLSVGTLRDNAVDAAMKGRIVNGNTDKMYCKWGHLLIPDNTFIRKGLPYRECRTCRKIKRAERTDRQRSYRATLAAQDAGKEDVSHE